MRYLFKFAILPFLLFSNISFANENIKKTNISDKKTINLCKLSTNDKMKIGASGVLELFSKSFKSIGITCIGISTFWFTALKKINEKTNIMLDLPHTLPCLTATIGIPTGFGGVGIVSGGIGYGLEYLSKKAMPSEQLPEKIIVVENPEKNDIQQDEHIDLNKRIFMKNN